MPDYTDLDPSQLKPGLVDGPNLKPGLVTPLYTGGTPTAPNQIKPNLRYPNGQLKPGLVDGLALKCNLLGMGVAPDPGSGFSPASLSPTLWVAGESPYYDANSPLDGLAVLRSRETYGDYRAPLPPYCLKGDGVNDYSRLTGISVAGDWTVCGWIKPNSSADPIDYPIGLSTSTPGIYIEFGAQSDSWGFYTGAATIPAGQNLDEGTWYHLAVVKSGTTYSLYRNGVLAVSTTGANVTINHLVLSYRGDFSPGACDAYIFDVRIYSAAKTAGQIAAIAAGDHDAPDTANIYGGWWLNERSGATHYDWSGNGRNLTIYSAATTLGGGYHVIDYGIPANPANSLGFSLSGSTVVPRDESSPSSDVLGGALGNAGQCPYPVNPRVPCLTGNGSTVYAVLPTVVDRPSYIEFDYHRLTDDSTLLMGGSNGTQIFSVQQSMVGRIVAVARSSAGIAVQTAMATGLFANGEWCKVRVEIDWSASGVIRVYKNGVLITTSASGNLSGSMSFSNLHLLSGSIGNSPTGSGLSHLVIGNTVPIHYPLQEGAGRDLHWVAEDGTYGVDSAALVNGVESEIWANHCPSSRDWCIDYGGRIGAGGHFVPASLDSSICADGNPVSIPAGTPSPLSILDLNPYGAAELAVRGVPHEFADGDDLAAVVTPSDSAFASADRSRVVILPAAATGDDLTDMEGYVA